MADALGDQTKKVLIFVEQSLRSSLTEKEKAIAQNRQNEGFRDQHNELQISQQIPVGMSQAMEAFN
jgi:hypothetical protein